MASAAFDEPSRGLDPKSAEAADDKMGARRIDLEFMALWRIWRASRWRRADQNLSDVAGLLHQPHRLHDIGAFKDRVRQRRKIAAFETCQHFAEQPPPEVGPRQQHLVEIDPEIAQIAPEGPEAYRRVGEIVAFAQLDEASERLQAGQCCAPSPDRPTN